MPRPTLENTIWSVREAMLIAEGSLYQQGFVKRASQRNPYDDARCIAADAAKFLRENLPNNPEASDLANQLDGSLGHIKASITEESLAKVREEYTDHSL